MVKKKNKNFGGMVSMFVTLTGAIFFIIGCDMHGTSFGADFYTYVYHGLAYIVQLLSCLLMAIGLIAKCYFSIKHEEIASEKQVQYTDISDTLPNL